jgi:transcription termination/antitermination protein NusG
MDYRNWNAPDSAQWYAVRTRSRQEKAAATMLEALGVSHFLPLISQERQWSDRKKMVTVPMFPGYLFVRIMATSGLELRVRQVPGVVDFVGNQNGPSAVPEDEIQNVRALLSPAVKCFPCPFLKAGDRVRIVSGALAGIEGLFIRCGARSRVVVSVEIIQRSIAVDVSEYDVEPLRNFPQRQSYSVFAPSPA